MILIHADGLVQVDDLELLHICKTFDGFYYSSYIPVPDVSVKTMISILDYSTLKKNNENLDTFFKDHKDTLYELSKASDFLDIPCLFDRCCTELTKNIERNKKEIQNRIQDYDTLLKNKTKKTI